MVDGMRGASASLGGKHITNHSVIWAARSMKEAMKKRKSNPIPSNKDKKLSSFDFIWFAFLFSPGVELKKYYNSNQPNITSDKSLKNMG